MFEIGSSLREARERRGLSHAQIERDTRIRTRYLRALEDESFELIPGRVYAKGFLRAYADYLGLDGQQFVDEFSSRVPEEEEPDAGVALQPIPRRGFRVPATAVAALVVIAVVVGLVAWLAGAPPAKRHASRPPPAPPARVAAPEPPRIFAPGPRLAKLTLTAARGACWLDAHAGSQTGPALRTGMLEPGQSLRLSGRRIWIRLGDPTALDATLNGRPVQLPTSTPVNVLVTKTGIQTVA
jgi:Helix-turn-helix domain/RodZ C-terminal domain